MPYVDSIRRRSRSPVRPVPGRPAQVVSEPIGQGYLATARFRITSHRRSAISVLVLLLIASGGYFDHSITAAASHPATQAGSSLGAQTTKTPVSPGPKASTASTIASSLSAGWQSALAGRSGAINIAVYDHNTGQTFHYAEGATTFDTASIVKLSILEKLLLEDQSDGKSLSGTQLVEATRMIENSDNNAATYLWNLVGGTLALNNLFAQVGATASQAGLEDYWGLTQTTALDQLRILNAVAYPGTYLSTTSAAAADALLHRVEADQRWGVSGGVPSVVAVDLKNGWLERPKGWDINSIGHVYGNGADYTIAVLTSGNPTEQYGISTIQSLSGVTWDTLAPKE
jgi:beta-lactamase class A